MGVKLFSWWPWPCLHPEKIAQYPTLASSLNLTVLEV